MSWRTTISLGVTFVVLLIVWGVWKSPEPPPRETKRIFEWLYEQCTKVEVQPLGEAEIIFERRPTAPAGITWWITKPIDRPAWEPFVSEMLGGLRDLTNYGAVPPGTKGHDLEAAGVDKPELVVHVHRGDEKKTFKFGRTVSHDPSQRWFLVEGDANLYFGPQTAFEPYKRSLSQFRNHGLVFIDRIRVHKVELLDRHAKVTATKCTKCEGVIGAAGKCLKCGEPGPVGSEDVVDVSEFEFLENRSQQRGWYWTKANGKKVEERLDEVKVSHLLSELMTLQANDFIETSDLAKYGLDKPGTLYRLHVKDGAKVGVLLGKSEKVRDKDVTYVMIEGAGEVALVETRRLDQTERKLGAFRSVLVYDFERAEVAWVELAITGLGRVQMSRHEERLEGQPEPVEKWTVEHPAVRTKENPGGLLVNEDQLEIFMNALLSTFRIKDKDGFLGPQPDLSLFGLNPPMGKLTIQLNRRNGTQEQLVYPLGCKVAGGDTYFMKPPPSEEVFAAHPDAWRRMERLELNFRDAGVYYPPQASLIDFSVDLDPEVGIERKYYRLAKQDGKWVFTDSVNKGAEVDEKALGDVRSLLSFIAADEFITRRPEEHAKFGFQGQKSFGKVEIVCDDRKLNGIFKIGKGVDGVLYGMMDGDPTVFKYKKENVDTLRKGVRKK
jgi:hypothetical protein